MLTTIPFCGFYESFHASALDSAIESTFADDSGDPRADIVHRAINAADWGMVHAAYAAEYATKFAQAFNLPLKFESMKSPKEYNFSTDIIYCTIDATDVEWLFATCDKTILNKIARETFTSRSGFISFYNPDFAEWGETALWDHNQLGVLIRAHVAEQNPDFDQWAEHALMENAQCNGVIENWIFGSNPAPLNRLSKINSYLNTRLER